MVNISHTYPANSRRCSNVAVILGVACRITLKQHWVDVSRLVGCDLTLKALIFVYENIGDQRVYFNLTSS